VCARSCALLIGLLFVGAAVNVERADAATFTQVATLAASGGAAGDELGYSSAISGGTVVVGAPFANSNKGAVYVYVAPSGSPAQTAKLTASNGASGDGFGTSVAIQGNTIVVGAPGASSGKGAVYVFKQSGGVWSTTSTPNAELTSSSGSAGNLFGTSVAIDGSTIAVGAPGATQVPAIINSSQQNDWCDATAPGAAYVFEGSGGVWSTTGTPNAILTGAPSADVNLGTSVAVSGSTVVAGAPCATVDNIAAAGELGLFAEPASGWASESQDTWLVTPQQTLGEPSEGGPARGDELGTAVAMSGDEILAGAPGYINSAQPTTSYLFYRPDGEPPFAPDTLSSARLTPTDMVDEDRNGASVAIDGGVLAEGGPISGGFTGQQAAYAESGGSWIEASPGPTGGGTSGDFYGTSTGVSGQTIVGGAPGATVSTHANQGEAYVNQAPGPTATTDLASPVTQTAAVLNGVVNPEGDATSCEFVWGRTTAYGNSVPCSPSPGSGTSGVAVAAVLAGLSPGTTYHFQVVTSNSAGSDVGADQQFTTAPTPTAPLNVHPPSIAGKAKEGSTLTDVHGSWTNNPTSYSYRWERCTKSGGSCAAISGATGQSYSTTFNDVGHTLRVQETATAGGLASAPATSAATATVALVNPPPPKPLKTVDLIPEKGHTLVKSPGQHAFHELVIGKTVKIGSLVDVTKGSKVKINVASVIKKVKQSITVTQGEMKITQALVNDQAKKDQKQVQTTLTLTKKEVALTGKQVKNTLAAQVTGDVKIVTNALTETIAKNAKVVTQLETTETLTKVESGLATVKDLKTDVTKELSAGESLIAKLIKKV
jgi:FG-GAP repeat